MQSVHSPLHATARHVQPLLDAMERELWFNRKSGLQDLKNWSRNFLVIVVYIHVGVVVRQPSRIWLKGLQ